MAQKRSDEEVSRSRTTNTGVREQSGPDVRARSRMALTHLLQGQNELAESETKAVLAVAPDDVLALTTLAQAQAAQRRWSEAQSTMVRALQSFHAARRNGEAEPADLVSVAHMLAAFGDDLRLYHLYRRCVRGVPGTWDATVLTHMGIAAFNTERYTEARWLWRMALRNGGELVDVLEAFLFSVEQVAAGRIPAFILDHRIRPDAIDIGEANPPGFVKALALQSLWHGEDAAAREAALDVLAQMDDPWIVGLLFDVVRVPELPDDIKMKAGIWLVERGFVDEDEPVEMHVDGRLQEVFIEAESAAEPITVELGELLERAVDAYDRGDEHSAEEAYREILRSDADCVPALVGLANICRTTGRMEEAERMLSRALRNDPADPIILFNLAVLWAQQHRFDKAQTILGELQAQELPEEMQSSYYALAEHVALQSKTGDTVRRQQPQAPISETKSSVLRDEERPIDPAWPWSKALVGLTLKRLQATARRLQVKNLWKMRKAELSEAIAGRLRSRLPWVWQALSEEERAALRWIDEQGGIVTLERLRERFGPSEASDADEAGEPQTVAVRLQSWGLMFVGRLRGTDHPVAVVLEDTRKLLREVWRRA